MVEANVSENSAAPLLRERGRHTRWFALAIFLLYAGGVPVISAHPTAERLLVALGSLLIVAGGLLRVFCALFIGGWKNQRLTAAGPYALVRNPLYVGSLIAVFGVGLCTGSATVTVLLWVCVALYYDRTVRREEGFLVQQFGAPYRDYLAQVPRWIPRWPGGVGLPAEVPTKPRYVLRGMRDITALLLAPLVCEGVRALHAWGLLPALYRLW